MSNVSNDSLPEHPFVACFVDGVPVNALIDTGSMKSFVSDRIYNVIDFNCAKLNKSQAQRCTSITGGDLDIAGTISAQVTFQRSKHMYHSSFLVTSNIPYDCVLGWDFIMQHKLGIRGECLGGRSSYQLVGPYGNTPIHAEHPAIKVQSNGIVITEADSPVVPPKNSSWINAVLVQSQRKGVNKVTLTEGVAIPGRTEIILEGKIQAKDVSQVGMISASQSDSVKHLKGLHIAHLVVTPVGKIVPIRVANTTANSIELAKGCKVAEFCPLVQQEVTNRNNTQTKLNNCNAVQTENLSHKIDSCLDSGLSNSDKQQLRKVLGEFEDLFSDTIGQTNIVHHKIDTGENPPIRQRARRMPYAFREESDKQISNMLDQGIITPSTSPWASPIVLVRKKSGDLRFCIDYRKLNQITRKDAHPLPRVDDLLDSVGHAKYFTTLDLKSGYWQIPVHPDDREKTAFVTHSGLYEFNRMPFGLATAPATFQRAMELVLAGLTYSICLCYLDDIIIFSNSIGEHCERLRAVLSRFRQHNLRLNLSKCSFAARSVHYLGHLISEHGISPLPSKVDAIKQIPVPKSVKDVRSFLGLSGYYRRFIKNYATISAPLTKLTTNASTKQFLWTPDCDTAFRTLKTCLCSSLVLIHPKFDREFILQTDASDIGLGAILSQLDDNGCERPIAYASKTLSARERKYCTTEKEAFAVIFGIRTFRTYLLGRHFKVITDHSALKWLDRIHLKGRLERWVMELQEFQFSVEHKPGKLHSNADALSRLIVHDQSSEGPHKEVVATGPTSNIQDVGLDANCAVTLNPTVNLRKAQHEDPIISQIIEMKTRGVSKRKLAEWRKEPHFRPFWYNYERLFVRDGLLYRSLNFKNSHPDPAVVVPEALRTDILKGTHDSPFTGHLGVTRTLDRIRKRFFWPNMQKFVENYIRQCDACIQRKSPGSFSTGSAPLQSIEVSEPFTFWALDYMGPLPETGRGNRHILVLMDHFTKWCEAFPTPDQKASTVAKLLVDKVFSRFGPPVVLHSDQGANFESTLMHEVCDVMGITKTRTTAYHPQCDGQVERQNRTLQDMLAAFCTKHETDWDLWLDAVVFAYNTSRHETLHTSPFELVFGRVPRLPIELELGLPLKDPSTQSEYIQSVRKLFKEVREITKVNLDKAREKQQERQSD